jgi:hypothetical protein
MLTAAKLIIGNVNHTNSDIIRDIAGIAGYALSVWLVNDETRMIRMVWEGDSELAEHHNMIGAFAMAGFTVKVDYE